MATSPAYVQLEVFNQKLSEYFQDLSQALSSNSAPPDIAEYLDGVEYTDILTMTLLNQKGGVNAHVGAGIDTIHNIEAIFREHGIAMKTKRRIYEDGIAEGSQEVTYYRDQGQRLGSMIDGIGMV